MKQRKKRKIGQPLAVRAREGAWIETCRER